MKTESKNVSPSRTLIPRLGGLLAAIVLLMVMLAPAQAHTATTPHMYINSVVQGSTVTLTTYNFPPNQNFDVRMGPMGTLGLGGTHVATTNSGAGGSFTISYNIPAALAGHYQVAIRMDSAQGYYAYNWFYNNTTSAAIGIGGTPGYVGIPTFSVGTVNINQNVTIIPYNFPANQTFTVTIGEMWTQGVGGYVVETITTDANGNLDTDELTFDIPPALYGRAQLSIRTQTAHANPYYSYNWFNNVASGSVPGHGGQPATIPTFKVCSVQGNDSVTIKPYNFPPSQTFNVTMGYMGTMGINGTPVGQITTDVNGVPTAPPTFIIPSNLWDRSQISIRTQTTHANPYYSYNWFYNVTADVTARDCP